MKTSFTTFFREQLIDLGCLIATAIGAAQRDKPWVICITGDDSSGKSLIALALDYCLNPERYEDAKLKDDSADRMLNPGKNEALKVVFRNVIKEVQPTPAAFAARIETILAEALEGVNAGSFPTLPQPQMQALVISNLQLAGQPADDETLHPPLVDIQINVQIGRGIFTRFIEVVYADPALEPALERFAFDHQPRVFRQNLRPEPS